MLRLLASAFFQCGFGCEVCQFGYNTPAFKQHVRSSGVVVLVDITRKLHIKSKISQLVGKDIISEIG
jgi:hypothetical protein